MPLSKNPNIDDLIEEYDYDNDRVLMSYFHPIAESLWDKIKCYGEAANDYGAVLSEHLKRTSKLGEDFLVDCLGFSEQAGHNFYEANLFQDLGKIHPEYDPAIWDLPHRPTEEERAEKRKHVARGAYLIEQAIEMYHHERIDGTGRYGLTGDRMGNVLKAICIIDAFDGDMIKRPHQPAKRTPEETLERMQHGEKYQGAFDTTMLAQFIDFYKSRN